jgi:hypothetical protein
MIPLSAKMLMEPVILIVVVDLRARVSMATPRDMARHVAKANHSVTLMDARRSHVSRPTPTQMRNFERRWTK